MRLKKPNKRMVEYWFDESEDGKIIPIKMPYKYLIESFCDMVGAGKAYSIGKGKEWKCSDPLDYYYTKCKDKRIMNKESENLLVYLLVNLKQLDEAAFIKWYKENKKSIKHRYERGEFCN